MKRILISATRICLVAYVGTLLALVWAENWIVYPIPSMNEVQWSSALERSHAEEVQFDSGDETKLCGWFFKHPDPKHIAIFCHGNGEDVLGCSQFVQKMSSEFQMSVLAFDYRGYGKSDGKPSEKGIQKDAEAAFRWLQKRMGKRPDELVLIGRSLGGGVAMQLAEKSNSKAILLMSTFSSMPDIAAGKYPFFPVRLAMRNRYPSLRRMTSCRQPLLQFHGNRDQVIPIQFGKALFEASPATSKSFVELEGLGHNYFPPVEFWQNARVFFEKLSR